MFYFEQRDHFARWWPCTAQVEPKERSAEGAALSPDGPLYATQFKSRRIAG